MKAKKQIRRKLIRLQNSLAKSGSMRAKALGRAALNYK
jgi:hypothetical protein